MTKKEFAAALDSALKAVRKEYGFTQEKMAAVLGISKKTLVEIEKGRSSLGWTGAAAFAAIFRESCILQAQFGGDLDDLVEALAFAEAEPQYPKTMGGRVWWREIWKEKIVAPSKAHFSGPLTIKHPNINRNKTKAPT